MTRADPEIILTHTVVAMDAESRTIRDVFSTQDWDEARRVSGKLTSNIKIGDRVAGYEVVSEPISDNYLS